MTGEQKIMIITGANSGIGKVTALELARENHMIVMACRNKERAERARQEIMSKSGNNNIHLFHLDLSSFKSIRGFVEAFRRRFDRVDVLVNNAGVMMRTRKLTEDGYETHLQVNYLGAVLLTELLKDLMKAGSRIVNVSSVAHRLGKLRFDDMNLEKHYSMAKAYSQSKLALTMYSFSLAKELEPLGITVNCLHPGVIFSNLGIYKERKLIDVLTSRLKWIASSPEKGAQTSIYLASSPEAEGITGKYFTKKNIKKAAKKAYDQSLSTKLKVYTRSSIH